VLRGKGVTKVFDVLEVLRVKSLYSTFTSYDFCPQLISKKFDTKCILYIYSAAENFSYYIRAYRPPDIHVIDRYEVYYNRPFNPT
jgi:hypothetical protein